MYRLVDRLYSFSDLQLYRSFVYQEGLWSILSVLILKVRVVICLQISQFFIQGLIGFLNFVDLMSRDMSLHGIDSNIDCDRMSIREVLYLVGIHQGYG